MFGALIDESDTMIQSNFLTEKKYASLIYSSKIMKMEATNFLM